MHYWTCFAAFGAIPVARSRPHTQEDRPLCCSQVPSTTKTQCMRPLGTSAEGC